MIRQKSFYSKVREGYPTDLYARYQTLAEKMNTNQISSEEHKEMISLSDQFEQMDAQRLEWLIELAALKNVSLEEVLRELRD